MHCVPRDYFQEWKRSHAWQGSGTNEAQRADLPGLRQQCSAESCRSSAHSPRQQGFQALHLIEAIFPSNLNSIVAEWLYRLWLNILRNICIPAGTLLAQKWPHFQFSSRHEAHTCRHCFTLVCITGYLSVFSPVHSLMDLALVSFRRTTAGCRLNSGLLLSGSRQTNTLSAASYLQRMQIMHCFSPWLI